MSPQFLHLTVNMSDESTEVAFRRVLDKALNWVNYMPNCWLLYTTSSAQRWYDRIKPILGPKDHVFICRVDLTERQGWLPKWVWEWIRSPREVPPAEEVQIEAGRKSLVEIYEEMDQRVASSDRQKRTLPAR